MELASLEYKVPIRSVISKRLLDAITKVKHAKSIEQSENSSDCHGPKLALSYFTLLLFALPAHSFPINLL